MGYTYSVYCRTCRDWLPEKHPCVSAKKKGETTEEELLLAFEDELRSEGRRSYKPEEYTKQLEEENARLKKALEEAKAQRNSLAYGVTNLDEADAIIESVLEGKEKP